MKDLYIGIDIGTSSTKFIVTDEHVNPLLNIGCAYPLLTPHPGYAEQNAVAIVDAVFEGLEEILLQSKSLGTVKGFSLSCAMHGVLFLDETGAPISPLVTWADKRCEEEAAQVKASPIGQEIYQRTGTPIHPMSPLCKLLWFKKHKPDIINQAAKIVSIKEYFVFRLTGQYLVDHSIASATGLFDLFDRVWYEPALKLAGIEATQLSEPVSTTSILPPLKPEHTRRLDLHQHIPWMIGASDGCLANLGVKADNATKAAITIGTSGAIRVTTRHPVVDKHHRLFTYILDDTHYIVGGSINNGGIALKWYQEKLLAQAAKGNELQENMVAASHIAPGSDGLICIPYFLGERAPHWNSFDRGVFFGVQFQHTAVHFLRAMLEGITITLQQIGEAIEDLCGPFDVLLANGGVLQSPQWLQIMADVFGKPVVIQHGEDASALGAIILMKRVFDADADPAGSPLPQNLTQRMLPNDEAHATYHRLIPVFTDLYNKLQKDFIQLKSI